MLLRQMGGWVGGQEAWLYDMDLSNPYGGFGGGSFFALENVFLSWSYMLAHWYPWLPQKIVLLFCFF
jgi:hypothetical protein